MVKAYTHGEIAKRVFNSNSPLSQIQKTNDASPEKNKVEDVARNFYLESAKNGMSMSAYMEKFDPSEEGDTTDAFERALIATGIRTTSDEARGIYADKVERFYASDQPVSIVLFPEFINREMRAARLSQDVLAELIAVRTPVDADVYRSIYIDTSNVKDFQMKRVAQGAEVPTVKIKTNEHSIQLHKYGVKLLASYESIRRMRVDQLRVHLSRIALQTQLDKGNTALDVIVNGDGNNNAATNFRLVADLDSSAAGKVTYKAYLSWLMEFYPYSCTTIAGNKETLLSILTMQFPGVDPLMLLAKYAQNTAVTAGNNSNSVDLVNDVFSNIRLLLMPGASDNVVTGIDKRFALEELSEIGANMTETDKIISQQFNEIVLTEVIGYDKLYNEACYTMTLNN